MGDSPSRLAATAPSEREPFDKEGKFPARGKASLLEKDFPQLGEDGKAKKGIVARRSRDGRSGF